LNLTYLVAIADGLSSDILLGRMTAKIRYHDLIDAVGLPVSEPVAALVEIVKDGPDLVKPIFVDVTVVAEV